MILVKKLYPLFLLLFLLGALTPLNAQGEGEVIINGTVIMRITAEKGMDVKERSQAVTERIEEKVRNGASVKDITVRPVPGGAAIVWGTTIICVVDQVQAKANNTTPPLLAKKWVASIVALLGEKPLRLSKDSFTLPVGEEVKVSVLGGGKGELRISCDNSLVEVTPDNENTAILIRAKAAGNSKVLVQKGSARGIIRVCVKDWAGKISSSVVRQVTGDPVPADIQIQAALNGVMDAITLQPGAQVALRDNPHITIPLQKGEERIVSLPVLIEGKGYFPVEGTVKVQVRNMNLPFADPSLLMISNRPEELKEDGILFQGRFSQKSPVRLFYSHKNGSAVSRKLWITVKNLSRKPSRILVLKAYAGPDKFEVMAGHKAAMRYLEYHGARAGYVLDMKGMSTVMLDDYDMAPNFTLSGICDLQTLEGEECEIEVKTTDKEKTPPTLRVLQEPFDPFKIHPYGIFPGPSIEITKSFSLPCDPLVIEVGKWPWLIDATTGEPNTGNYGVVYSLKVNMSNKTGREAHVNLTFTPLNGTSLGSFLINGKLFETGVVKPPESARVTDVVLMAGEERMVEIVTLPEAGSCYPVTIKFSPASF